MDRKVAIMAVAIALSFVAGFVSAWISKPVGGGSVPSAAPACPLPTTVTKTIKRIETTTITTTEVLNSITTVTKTVTKTLTSFTTVPRTKTVLSTIVLTKVVTKGSSVAKPLTKVLIGSSYPLEVLKLIERANKSVYVMMFAMKYYPGEPWSVVNKVIYALCSDAKKGLDVRVLVDYVTYKEYRPTIDFLKKCGVEVKVWKECGSIWKLHAKVVIVDGKYVVVGSHNWTYSAFSHNIEVSVEIESPSIASRLTNLFLGLWRSTCSFTP